MEDRLRQLEHELSSLSAEFEQRVQQLKAEIADIRLAMATHSAHSQRKPFTYHHESVSQPNMAQTRHDYNPVHKGAVLNDPLSPSRTIQADHVSPKSASQPTSNQDVSAHSNQQTTQSRESWWIEWCSLFFEMLFETAIAKPLNFIKASYQHYQQRGLAAVFMLTLAGIVTMTLGFGYLLQYSFSHWLSDTGKIILSFGFANVILMIGLFIHKRFSSMSDYASALIGLSLILNFVCSYFGGAYFLLFSMPVTVLLLLAFSIIGSGLARAFDTKVVACIALIGGTLAPLMFLNAALPSGIFVSYCALLAASGWWLSAQMRWPWLSMGLAVVQILAMQIFISHSAQANSSVATDYLAIIALTLLFMGYLAFSLLRLLSHRRPQWILLPLGLLMAYLTLALQLNTTTSAWVFIVNAMLSAGLFVKWRMPLKIRLYLWLFAGVFIAFAIGLLLNQDLMPLLWMLEAGALVWLGAKFRSVHLRMEALLVFVVGFVALLQSLGFWVATHVTHVGGPLPFEVIWVYALVSVMLFIGFEWLLRRHKSLIHVKEQYVWALFSECFSVWIVVFAVLSAALVSVNFAFNLAALMLLVLFVRAFLFSALPVTQLLMWLSPLLLLVPIVFAVQNAHSLSFRSWTLAGQLASVHLLLMLWVYSWFYHRYLPNSVVRPFAYGVKIVGYLLLPIIFIPEVVKRFPDYLALAACLSFAVSLGIRHWVDNVVIRWQSYALSLFAAVCIIVACLDNKWQGLAALGILTGFYVWLMSQEAKAKYYRLAVYYQQGLFMLMIGVAVMAKLLTNSWFFVSMALALMSWGALLPWPSFRAVRPSRTLILYVACTWTFISLLLMVIQPTQGKMLSMVGLLVLTSLWLNPDRRFLRSTLTASLGYYRRRISVLWLYGGWHSVALVSYCTWAFLMSPTFNADVQMSLLLISLFMLLHASILLMLSLRQGLSRLNRLSMGLFSMAAIKVLFFDLNDFDLVYKVIVFMLMGVLLLGVSFIYQRLKVTRVLPHHPDS